MFDSRNPKRRGRRSAPSADVELDHTGKPLNRDYGYGFSEEGRPITGVEDGSVHDPQAEIFDEQGETSYHNLSRAKGIRMCAPDQHELVPEGDPGEEIPGTQSMTCRHCPYGVLQPVE